jgi:chorismate synthase
MQKNKNLDNTGAITEMTGKASDPCVVPRAVPIVEAMAAIVLADFYLINKLFIINRYVFLLFSASISYKKVI